MPQLFCFLLLILKLQKYIFYIINSQINTKLYEKPTLINRNAEVEWLLKAQIDKNFDFEDFDHLMDENSYQKYLIANEETSSSDDSD